MKSMQSKGGENYLDNVVFGVSFKSFFCHHNIIKSVILLTILAFSSLIFDTCNTYAGNYSISIETSEYFSVNVRASNGTATGEDEIRVISNCPYGYSVSILGPTDSNLYKNGVLGDDLIPPTTGTPSVPSTISDDGTDAWGYSTNSEVATRKYIGLSSEPNTILSSNAGTSVSGFTLPVYFGVSVSHNKTPGSYRMKDNGAISYLATANINCSDYTIHYNANGGSGTMNDQSIGYSETVNLTSNSFSRTNYLFAAWNTQPDGSGVEYKNGEQITNIAAPGTTINLYAQWASPIQDYTSSECQTNANTKHAFVFDKRDNNIYKVRYINNNCWMVSNLKTGAGTAISRTLSSVAYDYSYTIPSTDLSAGDSYTEGRIHAGNDSNGDSTIWYNYPAVSAGTILGNSNTDTDIFSICPAGWRLPTMTEFSNIISYNAMFEPVGGGAWDGGSPMDNSPMGFWWSNTPYNSTSSAHYALRYNQDGDGLLVMGGSIRRSGVFARCLLASAQYVDVNSIIDSIKQESGLDGYTFDVYSDGVLIADNVKDFREQLPYGSTVRVVANTGSNIKITANGDVTQVVGLSEVEFNPTWTTIRGITNYYWGEISPKIAQLYIEGFDNNGGIYKIRCPTWATSYGQNPINWYTAVWDTSANAYRCDIYPEYFGYWGTRYSVHLYMYDGNDTGTSHFILGTSVNIPSATFMQDYAKSTCQTQASSGNVTLYDRRDITDYEVRYINGNCWMVQNLNIAKGTVLTSSLSNVSTNYTVPDSDMYWPPNSSGYTSGSTNTGTDSNGVPTSWYNYCAATAGTICTSTTTTEAQYDICPAGWRMPSRDEAATLTGYESYFQPVKGGSYDQAIGVNVDYGFWWTTTLYSNIRQYLLYYTGSRLSTTMMWNERTYHHHVRCLMK